MGLRRSAAALFFAAYEQAKVLLPRLIPALDRTDAAAVLHMISASLGEVVRRQCGLAVADTTRSACLVRVPTEVVKQRQQTAAYGRVSSMTALQRVIAESGPTGLYRGFSSTVAREVHSSSPRTPAHRPQIPFCCIQFPLYEALKSTLAARRHQPVAALPSWQAALCGSVSGAIAAALTCPFDVAKTRIMLDRRVAVDADRASAGVYGTMSRIARTEGVPALWKGVVPRVIWLSLGGAVFLGVYEAAKGAIVGQRAE